MPLAFLPLPPPMRPNRITVHKPLCPLHSPTMTLTLTPFQSDLALTTVISTTATLYLTIWQTRPRPRPRTSNPLTARKAIHLTCGPALLSLWPFYTSPSASPLASTIPLLFTLRLLTTTLRSGSLARSISRSGDPREALQGPLIYSLLLLAGSLLLFRSDAFAIAVMQLCFGDAAAEIFGRAFGHASRIAEGKSLVGSLAFVLAAFLGTCAMLQWWALLGVSAISMNQSAVFAKLLVVSFACAGVELLSGSVLRIDDNLGIVVVAVFVSVLLFGTEILM